MLRAVKQAYDSIDAARRRRLAVGAAAAAAAAAASPRRDPAQPSPARRASETSARTATRGAARPSDAPVGGVAPSRRTPRRGTRDAAASPAAATAASLPESPGGAADASPAESARERTPGALTTGDRAELLAYAKKQAGLLKKLKARCDRLQEENAALQEVAAAAAAARPDEPAPLRRAGGGPAGARGAGEGRGAGRSPRGHERAREDLARALAERRQCAPMQRAARGHGGQGGKDAARKLKRARALPSAEQPGIRAGAARQAMADVERAGGRPAAEALRARVRKRRPAQRPSTARLTSVASWRNCGRRMKLKPLRCSAEGLKRLKSSESSSRAAAGTAAVEARGGCARKRLRRVAAN